MVTKLQKPNSQPVKILIGVVLLFSTLLGCGISSSDGGGVASVTNSPTIPDDETLKFVVGDITGFDVNINKPWAIYIDMYSSGQSQNTLHVSVSTKVGCCWDYNGELASVTPAKFDIQAGHSARVWWQWVSTSRPPLPGQNGLIEFQWNSKTQSGIKDYTWCIYKSSYDCTP